MNELARTIRTARDFVAVPLLGSGADLPLETRQQYESVVTKLIEALNHLDPEGGALDEARARDLAAQAHREIQALRPMQTGGPFGNMELEYGRLDADRVLTNHLY